MQVKYKLEIVIDALYERRVPNDVREVFPELKELASTRFYKVYGCVLDRALDEDETRLLDKAQKGDETIIDYQCEEVLPGWL